KNEDIIEIFILGKDKRKRESYMNYAVPNRNDNNEKQRYTKDGIPYVIITTKSLSNISDDFKTILNLKDIDNLVKFLGDEVHNSIQNIYNQLSDLQCDVDAIITGIDK